MATTIAIAGTAEARTAAELLSDRPLAPTDHTLLNGPNTIGRAVPYPDAPPMAPAAGAPPTEQQAGAMLDAYLAAEYPGDPSAQGAAEAIYNDDDAKQKIPSPSLRAALAALKGTIVEGAIDFILNAQTPGGLPKVTTVKVVDPSQGCASLSSAWIADGRKHIVYR